MNDSKQNILGNALQKAFPDAENLEVIKDLRAMVTDLTESENAVLALRKRLEETVCSLRERFPDEEDVVNVVSYIYWGMPEIKSVLLAKAAFGNAAVKKLPKFVKHLPTEIRCKDCNKELTVSKNLERLSDLDRSMTYRACTTDSLSEMLCKECSKVNQAKQNAESSCEGIARNKAYFAKLAGEELITEARRAELRFMPYHEYLRTPEWKDRRERHVRSAGFACQVCNARDVQLDVHHRTYERRGQELYQDLLVLCRDCHGLFHRQRKLAS